jgi:hypothetical protein
MLPDPGYFPTFSAESQRHQTIPGFVTPKLLLPKYSVRGWYRPMLWTVMPKTSINKDSSTQLRKYEIRISKDTGVSSPSSDAVFSKKGDHCKFRALISASTNSRHDPRSFGLIEYVCH